MKLKNKKVKLTLIGLLTGAILVPAIVTPIAYTYSSKNNKDNPYMFNGVKYNNYSDLISHVNKNTEQKEVVQDHEYKWSIGNSLSDKKYFNSSELLLKDSLSNIKTYDAYTSIKYNDINNSKGAFNEIDSKIVSQMELTEENSNKNIDSVELFQGRNDSKFKTEEQAKKSYLSVHDIYNFNGINFRNKTDLEHYIDQQDNPSMTNQDYFTIRNPKKVNGSSSLPISRTNLATIDVTSEKRFENDNYISIRNYVRDNANTYVSIKKNNNQSGYYYYDINDSSNIANINTRVSEKDINYTKIESNQGKSTYVVDVSKDDDHNLNGPYLYDRGGNILSSTEKKLWKKIDDGGNREAGTSVLAPFVKDFISLMINDKEEIPLNSQYFVSKEDMIFYFTEIKGSNDLLSGNSLNKQWFEIISFIKTLYPKLYENIIKSYSRLKETKRWNSFYKLPIIFKLIIDGLIGEEAKNDIIFKVKKFFTNLTLKIDKNLSTLNAITKKNGLDILKNERNSKEFFSLTNIFGFNNNSYDLSSNIDAILNNIVEFYPNMIFVMLIQNVAMSNNFLGIESLEPFIEILKKNSSVFGINFQNEFKNKNLISVLYTIFSSKNPKNILKLFSNYLGKDFSLNDLYEFLFNVFFENSYTYYSIDQYFQQKIIKNYPFNYYGSTRYINSNDKNERIMKFENEYKIPWLNYFSLYGMLSKKSIISIFDIYKTYIIDKIIYNNPFLDTQYLQKFSSIDQILDDLKKTLSDFDFLFNKYSKNYYENYKEMISKLQISGMIINSKSKSERLYNVLNNIFDDLAPIDNILIAREISNKNLFKKINLSFDKYDIENILNVTNDIINNPLIGLVLSFSGGSGKAIEAALVIIDAFIPKPESYSYEYNTGADDGRFVWDGGLNLKMFYGAINISEKNIDDMKFIDPILIQQPYSSSYYYYDGKKYVDFSELKRDAIDNFIKNPDTLELSDDVKKIYGFDLPNSVSTNQNNLNGNSIEELTDKIIIDLQQKDKNSVYYNSEIYKFSNGYSPDLNAIIKNKKQEILSQILPTKIVMLPNLDVNGFPIFNKKEYESSGNDGSLNEFILPGLYWNPLINSIETNGDYLKNKYIIINPNEKINGNFESNNLKTEDEVISEITKIFMKSFNVSKKTVIKQDALNTNSFNSLANKFDKYKVYQVNDKLLGTKYFLNESDALNYYYSINNMSMHQTTKDKYIYIFNNMQFNSKDELYKYIKNNAMEVK